MLEPKRDGPMIQEFFGNGPTHALPRLKKHTFHLPVRELQSVQLERGKPRISWLHLIGRDLMLSRLRFYLKMSGTVLPDQEWLVIMVPLRWRGDYRFNGQTARPYEIFLSTDPDGYTTSGKNRDTISIGLRRSRLRVTCADLAGICADEIELNGHNLALGAACGAQLHNRLVELMAASLDTPLGPGQLALGDVRENDFFSDIACLLLPHLLPGERPTPAIPNALRVVRQAERKIEKLGLLAPSLADLCAASGVGQTWVSRSFNEVYGTSPLKYLHHWRLSTARDRFFDDVTPPRSVKDVALSLGFTRSGRFAAEYRNLFGENPSETFLANTRPSHSQR